MLPAALLHRALYPGLPPDGPAPELRETHVSWIALAGDAAWKLKRPVRFPFLDYSTPARREAACRVELALNRRWAPSLYRSLAVLVQTPAGLRFRDVAAGEPPPPGVVEWAVRMRRFDAADELDALVAQGSVEPAELRALGAAVAGWQAAAPVAGRQPGTAALGLPGESLRAARDTLATLRSAELALPRERVAALGDWTERTHEMLVPELDARRAVGRVRECHGDLHAANVVRVDGRLTPFDGIDFDPRLRWIDCASDVAFLAMDLQRLGRLDLATAFLDGWLEAGGDHAAGRVLPFFLVARALVRCKVDGLRARELGTGPAAEAARAEALGFLALAATRAAPAPGTLYLTFGVSGSGKSWLASRLADRLPAVRLRSDVERKRLAGLAPDADSRSDPDADLYSAAHSARTYATLAEAAAALLPAGLDVLVDATFLRRVERERFAGLAAAHGAPLAILACDADLATLRARVAARRDDPSEATLAVLERQLVRREPLAAAERDRAVEVDTGAPLDLAALAAALRRAAAAPPAGGWTSAAPES